MARTRGSVEADQGDLERGFTVAARSLLRILGQRGRYFRMLASIETPVLLLQGDKDRLVNVAAARDAARRRGETAALPPARATPPRPEATPAAPDCPAAPRL